MQIVRDMDKQWKSERITKIKIFNSNVKAVCASRLMDDYRGRQTDYKFSSAKSEKCRKYTLAKRNSRQRVMETRNPWKQNSAMRNLWLSADIN